MRNLFSNLDSITITNFLTILMILGTIIYYFGFSNNFSLYNTGKLYPDNLENLIRYLSYQFIHGGVLHFLGNAIFMLFFGNIIERQLGKNIFLLFFLGSIIFLGFSVTFFSKSAHIGMSGFTMALISYYTIDAFYKKNEEYKAGILLLIINIVLGLKENISFSGHFFGAIYGIIIYLILKSKK